jgi:hypothetical protein
MHAFLPPNHQAFMTFDCGQGPLDFLIETMPQNGERELVKG